MVFENLLGPIFSPILTLEPVISIFIISLIITLITTLAYKYLTDQNRMKELKAEMKKYQEKIKKLKDQPEKAMKVQKEMMGKNMELMKQSFKPTLYTLIPIIIIFGWLNAHMAYDPLMPGEQFTLRAEFEKQTEGMASISSIPDLTVNVKDERNQEIKDGEVSWRLKGDAGEYQITLEHEGAELTKNIIITTKAGEYEQPITVVKDNEPFKKIIVGNNKITPLKGLPLVGNFGWLGTYIIFSIALSMGLRKILKVV